MRLRHRCHPSAGDGVGGTAEEAKGGWRSSRRGGGGGGRGAHARGGPAGLQRAVQPGGRRGQPALWTLPYSRIRIYICIKCEDGKVCCSRLIFKSRSRNDGVGHPVRLRPVAMALFFPPLEAHGVAVAGATLCAAGGAAGDVVTIDFSDFDPKLKTMASNAKEYQKQSGVSPPCRPIPDCRSQLKPEARMTI